MDLFSIGKGAQNLVIDSASSDMKIAVGGYNSKTGTVQIEKFGIVPLDADAVNDGAIGDSFGVVMALKHAMAKLDVRNKNCVITTDGIFELAS